MSVYPYKLAPLFKEKIWGGRRLAALFGKALPAEAPIGESWELADLAAGECAVANGARAGQSLNRVVAETGAATMGPTPLTADGRFPLLLKLLDATENLSVQVHPDEQAVGIIPDAALKTECWYVLASDNGSIYKGVKPGVGAEQFRAALADDNVAELLVKYDVEPGDFHFLPAGTVHALGAGVLVAEVQTPSDTTYRVSDWGRGREIHVERAMQCIHFAPSADSIPGAGGERLLQTEYFGVYLRSAQPGRCDIRSGRPLAWMILEGAGDVCSDDPDGTVAYTAGDTLLLPADLIRPRMAATKSTRWLEITLPPFE